MLEKLKKELYDSADVELAKNLQRFFKTGKGEYGEGDVFLGIKVPVQRGIAKKYLDISLDEIQNLLDSEIHEHRFIGLIILLEKYKKEPKKIFDFYIKNSKRINNWDLVDVSCHKIVGEFLSDKDRKILYEFANSENLWERRIAIVSSFAFIEKDEFDDAIVIARILLKDEHDLIHKAVGWVLREIGKKELKLLENFLMENYDELPRTTLRYAIEKFEEEKRKRFLKGEFD